MNNEDPQAISLLTYGIVVFLSAWGGFVNFLRRRHAAMSFWLLTLQLAGELTIASFVGIVVFLLCESAGVSHLTSAALVAISGHAGSRILARLEEMILNRYFPSDTIIPDTDRRH